MADQAEIGGILFDLCPCCGKPKKPKNWASPNRGRWPPNAILVHSPECTRLEGVRRVKGNGPIKGLHKRAGSSGGIMGKRVPRERDFPGHADADGLETVSRYSCAIACPACGCQWTAEERGACPECGEVGEWVCAVRRLGEQSGESKSSDRIRHNSAGSQGYHGNPNDFDTGGHKDAGTCARFYPNPDYHLETAERLAAADSVRYCAKAARGERDAGLAAIQPQLVQTGCGGDFPTDDQGRRRDRFKASVRNNHPCCKPLSLCIWLAKLLLPPPEYAPRRILVPFSGSGSEMIACLLAGWEEVVGIEMDASYCQIAEARLQWWAGWSQRTGEAEPKAIFETAKGKTLLAEPLERQLAMETLLDTISPFVV